MVGGVVAQVERPEAGAEAAHAHAELVGEAVIEARHVGLETVAPEADLDVDRQLIRDVGGELHRSLGGEAAKRRAAPDGRAALGREVVVELQRASDVAIDGPRGPRHEREHRGDERGQEKPARGLHLAVFASVSTTTSVE